MTNSFTASAALAAYRAAEREAVAAMLATHTALASEPYGDAKAVLVEDAYDRKFAADRRMHDAFMAYRSALAAA